jgi:hypothetical protein
MGYTTDFDGSLELKPALSAKQTEFINKINSTRRMKRDINKLMEIYKGKHGNPFAKNKKDPKEVYGHDGEFFCHDDGQFGQNQCPSIVDYNTAPGQRGFMQGEVENGQPGLWCQWCITEDGQELMWDGGEKFYNYVAWLKYIIKKFFIPWGIKANGTLNWYGEEREDIGKIKVRDNEIFVFDGHIEYEDEAE